LLLRFILIACALLTLFLALGCNEINVSPIDSNHSQIQFVDTPFVMAGSGSNLPVTAKLAEAYYLKTGIKIDVPGSIGSDGAINAVKNGSMELGLISKHLTAAELADGLKELPYAQVAVVFGAHLTAPDSNLSDSDIIAIVNGSKRAWADGTPIQLFLRQNNDSSNLALYDVIPGYKEALMDAYDKQLWQIIYRDSDMSEAIKDNKGALGLTVSTEIAKDGAKTKPLAYNGIAPTNENISNGTYKLIENLSFIYKGSLSKRAVDFMDYVFSGDGQSILEKWGSSPIRR
jgi:phosphate transport system substrate-binding protein